MNIPFLFSAVFINSGIMNYNDHVKRNKVGIHSIIPATVIVKLMAN
jgi:hypothetical protein